MYDWTVWAKAPKLKTQMMRLKIESYSRSESIILNNPNAALPAHQRFVARDLKHLLRPPPVPAANRIKMSFHCIKTRCHLSVMTELFVTAKRDPHLFESHKYVVEDKKLKGYQCSDCDFVTFQIKVHKKRK